MKEIAIAVGLGLGALIGVLLIVAAVLLFYGAIFGTIGAGIYLAFKWIVGLFGVLL